jgi:hypothetical protein
MPKQTRQVEEPRMDSKSKYLVDILDIDFFTRFSTMIVFYVFF